MSEDIDAMLASSELIASHDHVADGSEDGYVTMHLYKANDARYFRYVEASGMNSSFAGAMHFIEWIGTSYNESWKNP